MTTPTPTDEGNADLNQTAVEANDEPHIEEDDPIIAEMKAAEAEIAAQGGNPAPEATGDAAPKTDQQPAAEEGKAPAADDKKAQPIMVPKSRLDEVLSERDLLRDQVGYQAGVIQTLEGMKSAGGKPADKAPEQKTDAAPNVTDPGGSKVDDVDAAIEAAEKRKLELAERYDEGEISSRQWKEQEIAIDKEIRDLSNKRLQQVRDDSRAEAQAVVSAQQTQDWINAQALEIQKNHPNVSVIDATPPHIRDGIWNQIQTEAAQNLATRGIDAGKANADPRVKLALMQEKAKLTDRYTPESLQAFLPQGFKVPQNQQAPQGQNTAPGQKQPSPQAQNRGEKLELANSQPPSIAGMGNGADNGEITASDIENMSEDQMADLLQKAPHLVQRAVGSAI